MDSASPLNLTRKERQSLVFLASARTLAAFQEKFSQFALIGLLLNLLASGASQAPFHGDLLIFAVLPACSLLLHALGALRPAARQARPSLIACAIAQALFSASGALCHHHQLFWPAFASFALFAAQAPLFESALAHLIRNQAPETRQRWDLRQRLLLPAGMVLGTTVSGEWFGALAGRSTGWSAGTWLWSGLCLLSLIQVLLTASLGPSPSAPSTSPAGASPVLRGLLAAPGARLAGLGVAFFWFAATLSSAILVLAAREAAGTGSGPLALLLATRLTAAAGIGIALGGAAVSLYCRRGLELDLVPAAALGLAISFLLAVGFPAGSTGFLVAILCLGLCGGMLLVSLHAFLQQSGGPAYHESMLPAVQILGALAQVLAVILAWLLRQLPLPPSLHFAVLGLLSAGAMAYIARLLPRHFLRFFFLVLMRTLYRVHRLHPERIPREGGALLISNHVSYIDAFLLTVACPRPVRFVMVDHFLKVRAFGWFLRLFDVIPISPTRAKDAIRTTAEALRQGDLVCIFPEGQLTRTGMLNELKKGFELIARQAQCPVVPVYMDSVWGSIFSFDRFRYFFKLPRRLPYPVTVNFGSPVPAGKIDSASARLHIQDLSVEAFALRPDLHTTLGAAAIRGMRKHGARDLFVDLGQNLRRLTHRKALTTSLALAMLWRRQLPGETRRVGILLPPGALPALLHLATVFSGRVPVHLPLSFLQQPSARDAFLERHDIRLVLSSKALFPDQALPPGWLDMRQAVSQAGFLTKMAARLSQRFLPPFLVIRALNLHRAGQQDEAVAYADEQTGTLVSLSHLNLLSSVQQIDSTLVLLPGDRILVDSTCPSFPALLFGLWHPCLQKNTVLFRSLSARKIDPSLLLDDQQPQAVLLSPTFAGELLASAGEPPSSTRIFLDFSTGPCPAELPARLESAGGSYCRGFAPPGLGAIVSLNTADPNSPIPHHLPQTGNLPGSVGRLLPGLSARLLDATAQPLPPGAAEPGLLALRGSSLPGTPDVEIDGWPHHRLDVQARFDRQGFLTLAPEAT